MSARVEATRSHAYAVPQLPRQREIRASLGVRGRRGTARGPIAGMEGMPICRSQ